MRSKSHGLVLVWLSVVFLIVEVELVVALIPWSKVIIGPASLVLLIIFILFHFDYFFLMDFMNLGPFLFT